MATNKYILEQFQQVNDDLATIDEKWRYVCEQAHYEFEQQHGPQFKPTINQLRHTKKDRQLLADLQAARDEILQKEAYIFKVANDINEMVDLHMFLKKIASKHRLLRTQAIIISHLNQKPIK